MNETKQRGVVHRKKKIKSKNHKTIKPTQAAATSQDSASLSTAADDSPMMMKQKKDKCQTKKQYRDEEREIQELLNRAAHKQQLSSEMRRKLEEKSTENHDKRRNVNSRSKTKSSKLPVKLRNREEEGEEQEEEEGDSAFSCSSDSSSKGESGKSNKSSDTDALVDSSRKLGSPNSASDDANKMAEFNHRRKSGKSSSEQSSEVSNQVPSGAMTFIQIEAVETMPTISLPQGTKFLYEKTLLYKPITSFELMMMNLKCEIEGKTLKFHRESKRLLNRYVEEAKSESMKIPAFVQNNLLYFERLQSQKRFGIDRTFYRSFSTFKFHPIFCEPKADVVEIPTRRLFKIFFRQFRFTKHPQLLEEHALANRLEGLYEEYAPRIRQKIVEKLYADLQTERKIVKSLLQAANEDDEDDAASKPPPTPSRAQEHLNSLERHLLNVKALRMRLYEESQKNKILLKSILDLWLKLKVLRQTQEFQCTRFKLNIKIDESFNISEALSAWKQQFDTDLNEVYREELEVYYRAKRLWRKQGHRHQTREDKASSSGGTLLLENNSLDDIEFRRPSKPDLRRLRTVLKEKFSKCFNDPEEPRIEIIGTRVSDEEFYEKLASQNHIKLRSYYLKIFFDSEFVAQTRSYRLEPDLSFNINEVIGVFLERCLPKQIKIKVFEKSRVSAPKKVAKAVLPVNFGAFTSSDNDGIKKVKHNLECSSKNEVIAARLQIVLACENQSQTDQEAFNVPTTPDLEATRKAKYLSDFNPSLHLSSDLPEIKKGNQRNNDKINEIDDDDDNDDDDDDDDDESLINQDTCTFEELKYQFCSMDVLRNNARLKLLRSRYLRKDGRTKDLKFVPALDNELEYDVDEETKKDVIIEAGNWMDAIDVHKHRGRKYLKSLYEAIRDQCARLDKIIENSESLLLGDAPATWSAFFQALGMLLRPGRPLNPTRNNPSTSNSTQTLTYDNQQSFKIFLNVVRATGIPVRQQQQQQQQHQQSQQSHLFGRGMKSSDSMNREFSSGSISNGNVFMTQNLKYSNVRPFITLSYRDKFCRSITAEGSNPTWNEQLILQLSGSLGDLRGDIKISLFDEVIESQTADDLSGVRNMDIYQRIQYFWLGDYSIPIQSLLKRQRLEGVFELNVPKVLLGYKRPLLDNIVTNAEASIVVEIKENVQLYFYLNMEPCFDLPHINTTTLECPELREVRQHLAEWSLNVKELKAERFLEPLVCTADGKRVCMTRLLEPIPLPLERSDNLLDTVCRYAMLVNSLKHYDACLGFDGVWLNNQVLLDTTWGSAKDIGVLLCNYLLSLGIQCWLVLGLANPHGDTTFVLYCNEEGKLHLLDPDTGKRYFVKDLLCPLYKIFYVVSQHNIFCNIQTENRVPMTNFNFNDTSCWLPAFSSKKNPAPLGGVQKLNYTYHTTLSANELKKNIERKIMKKISSWRTMRKTIWNRAFQPRLLSILYDLEYKITFLSNNNASLEDYRYAEQLSAEYPTLKLYGFTLNFSYTNLTSISERIRATGIHLNSNKNVEFCVAVHVHPYPNNILSVWIFLMSIVPMQK